MRIFLAMFCSLIVAALVEVIVYNAFGVTGYLPGSTFNGVGNAMFAVTLATLVWRSSRMRLLSFATPIAIATFLVSCVGLILAGVTIIDDALIVGSLLIAPTVAIGAYPAGPDAALPDAAIVWAQTALLPIGAGLLLGALLRGVASPRAGPTSDAPPSGPPEQGVA